MDDTRSNARVFLCVATLAITACAVAISSQAIATEQKNQEAPEVAEVEPENQNAPEVTRAQFTSRVANREPTDSIERLTNDRRQIFFYSELRGLAGTTVRHRWEREGQQMAEVTFEVEANRWRVWSSKSLEPSWLGSWTASVVTQDGKTLASRSFSYHQK